METNIVQEVPALQNRNGFLVDAHGVVRGLEVPISAEPITGFSRVARHESLLIGANAQMIQRVRVVTLNEAGVELSQAVRESELNGNVQSQLLNRYQDTVYSASTEGSYVNRQTGASTTADADGAVEQLAFFQGISIGVMKAMGQSITDATSVPLLVYGLLLAEIQKLDAQGRL